MKFRLLGSVLRALALLHGDREEGEHLRHLSEEVAALDRAPVPSHAAERGPAPSTSSR